MRHNTTPHTTTHHTPHNITHHTSAASFTPHERSELHTTQHHTPLVQCAMHERTEHRSAFNDLRINKHNQPVKRLTQRVQSTTNSTMAAAKECDVKKIGDSLAATTAALVDETIAKVNKLEKSVQMTAEKEKQCRAFISDTIRRIVQDECKVQGETSISVLASTITLMSIPIFMPVFHRINELIDTLVKYNFDDRYNGQEDLAGDEFKDTIIIKSPGIREGTDMYWDEVCTHFFVYDVPLIGELLDDNEHTYDRFDWFTFRDMILVMVRDHPAYITNAVEFHKAHGEREAKAIAERAKDIARKKAAESDDDHDDDMDDDMDDDGDDDDDAPAVAAKDSVAKDSDDYNVADALPPSLQLDSELDSDDESKQ